MCFYDIFMSHDRSFEDDGVEDVEGILTYYLVILLYYFVMNLVVVFEIFL